MASKRDEQQQVIAAQQATITELRAVVADLRAVLQKMEAREAELQAKLDALLRKVFGKSSEKMPTPAQELRKSRSRQEVAASAQQKRKHNEERKAELETEVVPHAVPDERRVCPACASKDLDAAEPNERTDYGYVPGYFRRRVHRKEVLVCTCCATRIVADAPPRPFEKSPYEAGLIAHVVVQKCACSVPIYRLEKQFKWLGIPLSRSTMTDLFHAAAEKLKPLYQRLLHRVATSDIVLADETTLAMHQQQQARVHVDLPHRQADHLQVLSWTQRQDSARSPGRYEGHAARRRIYRLQSSPQRGRENARCLSRARAP